jgi:hypothetical protein
MRAFALLLGFTLLGVTAGPRQLVYAYTYQSSRIDDADHSHGVNKMDPGGGGTFIFHNVNQHFRSPDFGGGGQKRSGTISILVQREQAGGGLVVSVTETPADGVAAGPTTCVTFGDTTVVCDPSREVSPEAEQLLSVLGESFVDPSRLDNARHWRIDAQDASGTTADYTIERSSGTQLDIAEKGVRVEKDAQSKTTIDAKIGYDVGRSLPTTLTESTTEKALRGVVSVTISTQTTLTLQSDAAAK